MNRQPAAAEDRQPAAPGHLLGRSAPHVRAGARHRVEEGAQDGGLSRGDDERRRRREHHRHALLSEAAAARRRRLVWLVAGHSRRHPEGRHRQHHRLRVRRGRRGVRRVRGRRYTPDFVIRKKAPYGQLPGSGRVYIVEAKAENKKDDPVEGSGGRKEMAVRALEGVNADRLKYEIIYARNDAVRYPDLKNVIRFAEEPEPSLPLPIDRAQIAEFCRKWKIQQLEVFGSVLRKDFRPDSDVDFLVTFAPDARIGWDIVTAEDELSALVGRKVDLVTRKAVEQSHNWIRKKSILESARPLYVAG